MRGSLHPPAGYRGIWGTTNDLSTIKFCALMLEGIGLKADSEVEISAVGNWRERGIVDGVDL